MTRPFSPRPAATLAGPTDYVSHDYGSPPEFVEVAHAVFRGPPTLDPFSSEKWNDAGIRAHRIITAEQDGFKTPWFPACGKYLGDDDATTRRPHSSPASARAATAASATTIAATRRA